MQSCGSLSARWLNASVAIGCVEPAGPGHGERDNRLTIKARQGEGPVKRAIRNAGWLLAGKGVGGIFSLVYLALAARSLGAEPFGVFALILSYGQAVSNLAQFQSWQTLVRYGAVHVAAGQHDKLGRVICFTALLDLGAASTGAVLGVAGVYLIGAQFGWSDSEQTLAMLFSISLLFGLRGTPTGILRLFDRFDLAAYAETVLPAMRLAGALVAWMTGASILGYLVAWSLAELVTTADEVLAVRSVAERVKARLTRADIIVPSTMPPIGVMIEIPGAALAADSLAGVSDFFAIGTNDLTQYTLAIDRADDAVAHLYNPLHPAVLRLIHFATGAALRARLPVSLCGEMAGDPRLTGLLLGLGIRELSMSASNIPRVKHRIRRLSMTKAEDHARHVMSEYDACRINDLIAAF